MDKEILAARPVGGFIRAKEYGVRAALKVKDLGACYSRETPMNTIEQRPRSLRAVDTQLRGRLGSRPDLPRRRVEHAE